jgi:release factor glutamine methyltransferase
MLVEVALAALGDAEDPVVVDVGTGTGAVALAIKHERPDASVFATDVAAEAVELARANAERLRLDVRVLEGPYLQPLPGDLRGWVDLVVSNPPYVAPEAYADLPAEVRADPAEALLGGVEIYRELADRATGWLRDGGWLAVEIDPAQAEPVTRLLERGYGEVRVDRDLTGRDRVVLARRFPGEP